METGRSAPGGALRLKIKACRCTHAAALFSWPRGPGFGAALFEGTVPVTVQLSARRNARLLPFSSRRRLIS